MKRLSLLSIALFSLINFSKAQMVGADIFLKGNTVEVGMCTIGSFGSCSAPPTGYHPRPTYTLGFVADPAGDGWTVGTPGYMGDYFVPGSPHEGWDVMINGQWNRAWSQCGSFTTASGALTLTGSTTSYEVVGKKKIGNWSGSMGNLAITHKVTLDTTKTFFVIQVNMENTGTTTLTNIYYDRTVDPDNEEMISFDFTTSNTIVYQPSPTESKCLVTGIGLDYPAMSYLGLGAKDCRAKAYVINTWGLTPNDPVSNIYEETATGYLLGVGDNNVQDVGIGIIFKIGDLAPGESTSFAYAYILKEADLDSAFAILGGSNIEVDGVTLGDNDTLTVCRGKVLDVAINGGGAYEWDSWSPTTGLAYTSGSTNQITVQNETITYTIIGTTTTCPESDTIRLTIIPIGDTTTVNQEICSGEVYDFNGQIIYATGTYYATYSTVAEGCDSVIKLNLSVNPTPVVDIQADKTSLCEGEIAQFIVANPTAGATYTWLRDGVLIPGASGPNYTVNSIGGVYRVVGSTSKGCTDTSRGITITINPAAEVTIDPVNAGKVCIGDTLDFGVNEKLGYEYYWSPEKSFRYTTGARQPNVKGIMFEPENVIEVLAVNEYGCKDKDQIVVYAEPCCDVYVPTAFSPNGDGVNDYFNIKLQSGQKVVSFQIFDRFGAMVYDFNDRMKGWNGLINNTGAEANQAVYFYRIVYSCTDGRNYETKGDITLVR